MKKPLYLKNATPTILCCVAALGVIGTAVVTAKVTPKALERLKKAERKKGEPLNKKEIIISTASVYILSALIGAGTIACIFGANALNKKQQASLISAYGVVSDAYKNYMSKVRQLYGEEAHQKIMKEIEAEKAENDVISFSSFLNNYSLDLEDIDDYLL